MRGFRISGLHGALAAISIGLVALEPLPYSGPQPTKKRRRKSFRHHQRQSNHTTSHGTNGARECIRRMTQIARGSLREQNGLVR